MKKIKLLLLLLFAGLIQTYGQSIDTYLISNGGVVSQTATNNYQWTIGEIAVSDHTNGLIKLSEGFQQVYDVSTVGVYTQNVDFNLTVFPNPALDYFTIENNYEEILSLDIYDILGKQILTIRDISIHSEVNISQFQSGSYLLKFKNSKGQFNIHKLIKI